MGLCHHCFILSRFTTPFLLDSHNQHLIQFTVSVLCLCLSSLDSPFCFFHCHHHYYFYFYYISSWMQYWPSTCLCSEGVWRNDGVGTHEATTFVEQRKLLAAAISPLQNAKDIDRLLISFPETKSFMLHQSLLLLITNQFLPN